MATEEEIKIKITADTSDFKKEMKDAAKSTEELGKTSGTGGGGGRKGFNATMQEMSNTTEGVKDKFKGIGKEGKKSGGILSKAFDGVKGGFMDLGASSKLATAGAVGVAIAAFGIIGKLAIDIGKKVMQVSGQMAKMYNPAGFEKATNEMNASITKMKTSLGAVLEPVYKAMTGIVGGLADAFNGILETVLKIYATIVGFLGLSGTLSRSAEDYSDAMEEATASADAGLAAFDKLNTLDTSGMGDAAQSERIRNMMADAAEAAEGMKANILDSLNPMKWLGEAFKSMGLESQWNNFVESGTKAWEKIVEFGEKAWGVVVDVVKGYWDIVGNVFSNMLENGKVIIGGIFDYVVEMAKNIAAPFLSIWSGIWSAIFNLFTGNWQEAVESLKNGFKGAFEAIINWIPNMWNKILEIGERVWNQLSDSFRNIFGGIIDTYIGYIKNAMNSIIDIWNNSVANMGFEMDLPWGGKWGVNTYGWKLPKLATGGVVEPNDPFMAVLGDNKREKEIVSPESTMEGVVRKVLSEDGGQGEKTIELTVNLDGRKIARGIYDYMTGEARRRGSSQWQ